MKKFFIILSALLIAICTCSAAFASCVLSDAEKEILGTQEGFSEGFLFKYYTGSYFPLFSEGYSAESMTSPEFSEGPYYVYLYENDRASTYNICKIKDNEYMFWGSLSIDRPEYVFLSRYNEGEKMLRSIGVDTKVNNVFCLDGDRNCDGIYIVFETDAGEYVYFKDSSRNGKEYEEEYIMPIDVCRSISKEIFEYSKEHYNNSTATGWNLATVRESLGLPEKYNMQQYKITDAGSSNPWYVVAGIAAVVAVVGVAFLVVGKKLRRR